MQPPPKVKVFVEGRYRKVCRDLPQTVFFCPDCKGHPRRRKKCARCEGFGKLTRDSVQELVGWVMGASFKTRKNKFHGAGREDVDVRMLGRGRPFIMEMINPKVTDVDLAEIEMEINRRNEGRLEIEGLHWTEKTRIRILKETSHAKLYEAVVETEQEPSADAVSGTLGRRIQVEQRTPKRVAHRRADKARMRWVQFDSFDPINPESDQANGKPRYRVRISTQHGTYVKEAINGESGQTSPSLTELLGVPCQCIELDVLEILDESGEALAAPDKATAFGDNVY